MWWASVTLVIAALWALGGFTPFYRLVYAIVPGTKFFRAPSTMLYVVQFSVAVLAALGTERAMRGDVTRRYSIAWGALAVGVALLATTGLLSDLAASFSYEQLTERAVANKGALIAGAWRSAVVVACIAAILVLSTRRRLNPLQTAVSLAAVILLDLWSIERLYWRFSPPASVSFAANDITRYLNNVEQPVRVIAAPLAQLPVKRDPFLGSGALYGGDALMVHRIRSPLGYHGNQLDRYDIVAGRDVGYQHIANPAFWAYSNIQFFLTNSDTLPLAGATRVMGPTTSPVGTPLYLYRLPGDNTFAWVTPVIVKADDDAVAATILDPRFDVRRAAIFAPDAEVAAQQIASLPERLSISTTTTGYKPGHFAIDLSAPAPAGSALIVSENYYPGWSATVDGKPVRVWRADMSLMGVELPAGARRLEFDFASAPFERGKRITLFAAALSLGIWAAGLIRKRRRGGTSGQ
jgi:hypothetical protein